VFIDWLIYYYINQLTLADRKIIFYLTLFLIIVCNYCGSWISSVCWTFSQPLYLKEIAFPSLVWSNRDVLKTFYYMFIRRGENAWWRDKNERQQHSLNLAVVGFSCFIYQLPLFGAALTRWTILWRRNKELSKFVNRSSQYQVLKISLHSNFLIILLLQLFILCI